MSNNKILQPFNCFQLKKGRRRPIQNTLKNQFDFLILIKLSRYETIYLFVVHLLKFDICFLH
jgi:hypothetical protein